ncbi:hypothetical protein DW062_03085 [Clostridium sp. AF43-10]|nr:hypothetical protein DW062_03085 [Clostridium sp. AF43-10]
MGWFTKKKKGETTEEELQEVQTQETVAEAEEVETEKEISEVLRRQLIQRFRLRYQRMSQEKLQLHRKRASLQD